MILSSASNDDFRVWLLPLFWGLVILSLVSGYSIHIGRFRGWRIYSRKKQPSDFWFDWFLNLIVVAVITFFLLRPDLLLKR